MQAWLSTSSLIGIGIAILFALLASRDLRRGVLWYAALGAIPIFEVGAFSGNEMVQGIPLAEVLATALVLVWLLQRHRTVRRLLTWERGLLLLIPASILSLVSGLAWLDRSIPVNHVKLDVSIGQILLFAWPIGIYFVTSDVMDEDAWTRRFTRLVLLLALPQVVMLAVPASTAYLFWSTYFGVIAAPLAVARATVEPTRWKKLVLAMYLVPPLVQGVVTGKAFLYGYILVSTGIIVLVRARRLVWLGVPAIGLVAGLVALAPDAVSLPGPLKSLVQKEEEQKSWGGRAGRGQLTEDALEIWSNYPMLGVGPANSYAYMVRYSVIGTPHNQYAGILLECGVVGLVIVLAFVVGVLRFGWAAIHQSRDLEAQNFLLAWFGSFAALALVSTSGDYMLHSVRNGGIPMFAAFYIHWVFLGAAVGLARHGSRVRVAVAAPGMAAAPLTWMAARVRRPISAAGSR